MFGASDMANTAKSPSALTWHILMPLVKPSLPRTRPLPRSDLLKPFAALADVWCERYGKYGEVTISVDLAHLNAAREALAPKDAAATAVRSAETVCRPR